MPRKVLVCDNEDVLRALIRAALESADYDIVEARDGDESLELARSERLEAIVLDLMMPGKTGLEVLAELRADTLARTPVLLLTARAQAADRDAALAAGADHFLSKPFRPLELAAVVEELLAVRR